MVSEPTKTVQLFMALYSDCIELTLVYYYGFYLRFLHGLLLSICCCLLTKNSDMLNKNTLGAKNCEANQKQQLNGYTCNQNVWYLVKAKNYTKYRYVTYWYWKCCMHLPLFKNANKNIYDLIIQLQSFKGYFHNLIWLACHLATFFVSSLLNIKGGQVTKPIISFNWL